MCFGSIKMILILGLGWFWMAVIGSNVLKMTVLLGVISNVCKNNMVAMFVQYVMLYV